MVTRNHLRPVNRGEALAFAFLQLTRNGQGFFKGIQGHILTEVTWVEAIAKEASVVELLSLKLGLTQGEVRFLGVTV